MKRVLTIAGSDSGGGAGIQADLKTFLAFGVHGMSAVTALTAQNTVGVQGILEVPPEFVRRQIESVMTDIGADAAKTGMLGSDAIVRTVAEAVREFRIPNLVVDPVMVAKGGDSLLAPEAREAIRAELVPLAAVLTPNLPEAETLLGRSIEDLEAMKGAARELAGLGCRWVVLKGGHLPGSEAVDLLSDGREIRLFRAPRLATNRTHGTGCTFASAVAAGLARGRAVPEAVAAAKEYVTEAIREAAALGRGHGPTNHRAGLAGRW